VPTAWAGAALPRSLGTPVVGGTPGPPGTTTRYGTPLCSGTPAPLALPAAPSPRHLHHPQSPGTPGIPPPPDTRHLSHGAAARPAEHPCQCPRNCPDPCGRLSRFTSQKRVSSPICSPILPAQQLTPWGAPQPSAPHGPGAEPVDDGDGGWLSRCPSRVPLSSTAPSRPHRAAHGSLRLLLRPSGLPHLVDHHPPASTGHHHYGSWTLGSPLDPSGQTTTPHAPEESEWRGGSAEKGPRWPQHPQFCRPPAPATSTSRGSLLTSPSPAQAPLREQP